MANGKEQLVELIDRAYDALLKVEDYISGDGFKVLGESETDALDVTTKEKLIALKKLGALMPAVIDSGQLYILARNENKNTTLCFIENDPVDGLMHNIAYVLAQHIREQG